MDGVLFPALVAKRVVPLVGALVIAGVGIGYAVHEHSMAQTAAEQKQALAAQNEQMAAQLNATESQVTALTTKVNALASNDQTTPSPQGGAAGSSGVHRSTARRGSAYDPRFNKLQSQVDAQGKAIDQARSDLDSTRTDLANARTELSGSIAKTHDELVVLEKKGERNYFEFDITKSKEFKHEGPVSISLRKANSKRGYADLALIVDDRNLQQKHVNLYQPAMFYQPESQQPVEVVINDIGKDHIHGYVSAPKYRPSELAAATPENGDNGVVGQGQAAQNNGQPSLKQRTPAPPGGPPDE